MRVALRWPRLLLAASACGGGPERPLRIGVVVDCVGGLRALGDGELAAAQLPLIARGARPGRREPDATACTADARPGGASRSCAAAASRASSARSPRSARQLIEREHVDAVVAGGSFQVDGLALREVARRYPDVVFVAAANGPREVTLERPAANLYRVAPDYGQAVAGLATYAYRQPRVAAGRAPPRRWFAGWNAETAFVREFCALGGRMAERVPLRAPGRVAVRRPAEHPARRRRRRRARIVACP